METRTVIELRALCKDNGIAGYSKLKKPELIDLLRKSGMREPEPAEKKPRGRKASPEKAAKKEAKEPKIRIADLEARLRDLGLKTWYKKKAALQAFVPLVEAGYAQGLRLPERKGEIQPLVDAAERYAFPEVPEEDVLDRYGQPLGARDLRETILQDGFVLAKFLEPEQIPGYEEKFLTWVRHYCPSFDPKNPETWTSDKLPPALHGILKNAGQASVMWALRSEPKVLEFFSRLEGVAPEDLVSSFDGFNISPPKNSRDAWIHTDHPAPELCRAVRKGEDIGDTFQATMSLTKTRHAGTLLFPNATLYRRLLQDRPFLNFTWTWVESEWLVDEAGNPVRGILVSPPPGWAVVWHSKIFHQGYCGPTGKDKVEPEDLRVAAYLSMTKRSNLNEKEIEKRITWFEKGKTTGHSCYGPWASANVFVRHYGRTDLNEETEKLTEPVGIARRLIGYEA